jgi:flagellar capping protein FliD
MTRPEKERLAIVETKQDSMAKDIDEIKTDIKTILSKLETIELRTDEKFVTKRFMTKLVSISMGIATIVIAIWHEIKR